MIKKIPAALILAACLWGCQRSPTSGTEIPNELVGHEVIAGKGPAADAEIRLIPVGYKPGGPNDENSLLTYKTRTDAAGRFSLENVQPGQYNILAMADGLKSIRDSVPVTVTGSDLGIDTLKQPGTLIGTVALQPNHSPRTATVQVLGTNLFVNVDQAGGFSLPDLAPGQYRLRVETSTPGYTVLYVPVEVRSGRVDILPPLEPYYSLVPVITGLRAESSRDGCIRLSWDPTSYPNSDGYLIYRDSAEAILPSTAPIARVQKPRFIDTLYSRTPKAGQYSFADTVIREFTYRVRLHDAGDVIGPAYAKASAYAYSPEKVTVSGKWRLATDSAAFGARGTPAASGPTASFTMMSGPPPTAAPGNANSTPCPSTTMASSAPPLWIPPSGSWPWKTARPAPSRFAIPHPTAATGPGPGAPKAQRPNRAWISSPSRINCGSSGARLTAAYSPAWTERTGSAR